MATLYNRLAGQSLERIAALSDGIFAVAMTLLVLDLRVPVIGAVHNQQPLWASGAIESEQIVWAALVALAPRVLTYFMSFLTLGMFWVGQQAQLSQFARCNRTLTWIHLAFLLGISLIPFSTGLLAEFITYRLALVVYWLNLLLLGGALIGSWRYANHVGLLSDATTRDIHAAIERRIVSVQILYALGVALCVVNTYISIVFIVLLQLNSAIAPRIRPLMGLDTP